MSDTKKLIKVDGKRNFRTKIFVRKAKIRKIEKCVFTGFSFCAFTCRFDRIFFEYVRISDIRKLRAFKKKQIGLFSP